MTLTLANNYLFERRMSDFLRVIMSMINQLYVCVERNDNQQMFSIVRKVMDICKIFCWNFQEKIHLCFRLFSQIKNSIQGS